MKAITIIITAVLSLNAVILFSANPGSPLEPAGNGVSSTVVLSPETPAEATFENESEPVMAPPDPISLAPETPAEADFDDRIVSLAPETPEEADFE